MRYRLADVIHKMDNRFALRTEIAFAGHQDCDSPSRLAACQDDQGVISIG